MSKAKLTKAREPKESKTDVAGVSLKPKDAVPFTADHCSNCGLPVMLIYVMYAGREGRYEPRHAEVERIKVVLENGVEVEENMVVLFNGDGSCPVPERSKYAKYLLPCMQYKQLEYEAGLGKKEVEEKEREKEKERRENEELVRLEKELTELAHKEANKLIKGENKNMSTEESTIGQAEKTKSQIIREKIAAAKAKKEVAKLNLKGRPVVEGKSAKLTGGGKGKIKAPKKERAPKLLNLCGDGCGARVQRNFAMGHDARFHGWLKRLADGRMKPNEVPAGVAKILSLKKKGEGFVPSITEGQYLEQLAGKGGREEE